MAGTGAEQGGRKGPDGFPSGNEPDPEKCRTLRLVDGFCECIGSRSDCKYALPAGRRRWLCMHRNNYRFRVQYLNETTRDRP